MKIASLFVCLILCGCARPVPVRPLTGNPPTGAPPLPPMPAPPRTNYSGQTFSGKVAKALTPGQVTLEWNNYGVIAGVTTGIEGTTNLLDWYELTNLPASSTSTVTLYGRPVSGELYRAFNRWTQNPKPTRIIILEEPK